MKSESNGKPNLIVGAVAGGAVAFVCAIIWAGITFVTDMQLGLMAIGVGCAVGIAVKRFGNGTDKIYGIVGALEALFGCLAGNLFVACAIIAKHQGISILDILLRLALSPDLITTVMVKTFDAMDLLFYGIAIYEAYKFSFQSAPPQVQEAQP